MRAALVLAVVIAAAPALAEDAQRAQAKKLFVLATTNYELGRFEQALADFLEAYQKKPLPGFLFNIGLCHRKLGDHAAAVAAFEEYLAKVPKAENRADVETMLAEERAAAAAAPPPAPALVIAEPPPPPAAAVAPVAPETTPGPPANVAGDDTGGTWLWAAAGGAVLVAAAAGTVAAVALLSQPATTPPPTTTPLARVDLRAP